MKNKSPEPGDWLTVKLGSITHHGIYVSENEVIHFCSEKGFSILSHDMTIQKTDLLTFSQSNPIMIKTIPHEANCNPVTQRIEKAYNALGNGDYDFFFNNCEHFVHNCFFNERRSTYIESLMKTGLKRRKKQGINGLIDTLYINLARLNKEE